MIIKKDYTKVCEVCKFRQLGFCQNEKSPHYWMSEKWEYKNHKVEFETCGYFETNNGYSIMENVDVENMTKEEVSLLNK